MKSIKKNKKHIAQVFGENLRRIRQERGLSLRDLSALCPIDNADLSRIENAERNITLNTVEQLSEALETPYADFFRIH